MEVMKTKGRRERHNWDTQGVVGFWEESLGKKLHSGLCSCIQHVIIPIMCQAPMLNNNNVWRRQWHPTPVLLPGESRGWRSLVGCSPWGWKESDTTEQLHFHCSLSCIGEGSGNPLQGSCLENPRDRGAWWASVYGVTQSRTRLKWLSSSSSSNN